MKHVPMQHPSNEDLFAYRDGELAGEQRLLIEAHVVSCATCRELVDGLSGIEADLKSRPDDVGEEYYARMTESVLGKIGARSGAGAGPSKERTPRPAVDVPRVERRRPDAEPDAEGPRRRPRLPWFGVVGAGAAAAAVMVVVVMLAQRQGEWVRAPRPASPDASDAPPLATFGDSAAERDGVAEEEMPARERAKPEVLARGAKVAESDEVASTLNGKTDGAARERAQRREEVPAAEKVAANEPRTEAAEDVVADKKAQLRKDAANVAPSAQLGAISQKSEAMPAPSAAVGDAAVGAPSQEYAEVLRAYGLPPVYDPSRVGRDALLKAETDLRYLYMAGRAQTDSARVRLYLAEAARAKADPADSAAVEAVIHHYWRAIRLSREDTAVSSVARRRLADYLRETGREP